jgi:hypothetical protein
MISIIGSSGSISSEHKWLTFYEQSGSLFGWHSHKLVATIKEENLFIFHSLEEAQKSGRRGCKQCNIEK